jgi:hypothetical protein
MVMTQISILGDIPSSSLPVTTRHTHPCDTSTARSSKAVEFRYGETGEAPKKGRGMVIVYLVAAFVGGIVSCVLLWPYSVALALLSVPFGGSLLVLLTAVLVYSLALGKAGSSRDRTSQIDQFQKLQSAERQR